TADSSHQPKGDHNRRLSLGMDPDEFAAAAGITTEQLRDYERTSPDHDYDLEVAMRVNSTLSRLEKSRPNLQTGRSHEGHHAPILVHPNGDAEMDHSQHQRLSEAELTSGNLEGAPIYDRTNAEVGKVS